MKALIDSDVLIDYLQGEPQAKAEINRYDDALYSVVSWMEVMCGANSDGDRRAAIALFQSMERVELSIEVARKAVSERKALRLKLPDAIVLASADCEGCILVTRNSSDFDRNDPRVRIPYSL
ncbi:MAG: putative nucleic acid-binding protein [Verrucomicrobiales bacterium]|jgi:predicted nucleic acid-binding protein